MHIFNDLRTTQRKLSIFVKLLDQKRGIKIFGMFWLKITKRSSLDLGRMENLQKAKEKLLNFACNLSSGEHLIFLSLKNYLMLDRISLLFLLKSSFLGGTEQLMTQLYVS